MIVSSAIINGTVNKTGAGVLALTSNGNTFTGGTNVNAGTLLVNGVLPAEQSRHQFGCRRCDARRLRLDPRRRVGGSRCDYCPRTERHAYRGRQRPQSGRRRTYAVFVTGTTPGSGYGQTSLTTAGSVATTGSTLQIVDPTNFTPASGSVLTIIKNGPNQAISGTFAGLPEGATVAIGATNATISYVGNGVHDVTLTVVGVPPTVSTSPGTLSYMENSGPVVLDGGLTVMAGTSGMFSGGTVSITGNPDSAHDVLALPTNAFGISGLYNSATGVLTLSGFASVANYQTALDSITYSNSNLDPGPAPIVPSALC